MIKRMIIIILCLLLVMTGMVYAQTVNSQSMAAPRNLTVELKNHEDGYPYFQLNFITPSAVNSLAEEIGEDGELFYELEYKVGDGNWEPAGPVHSSVGTYIIMSPDDLGLDADIDIKANIYSFRLKFALYLSEIADEHENRVYTDTIYSPLSNVASIGIEAYQRIYKDASPWAEAELDKAAEYGFITDKIKDKMNGPITREELSEVIIKLYEKMIGPATYKDMSAFTDTQNPEIYKAYELGIVNGVGNSKFAPKELTNREQVSAMMYRAVTAVKPNADLSIDGAENFSDEELISSWALQSVKFMNKNGFLKGSNGMVDPKGTTTREQAVLMVVRVYEKYKN